MGLYTCDGNTEVHWVEHPRASRVCPHHTQGGFLEDRAFPSHSLQRCTVQGKARTAWSSPAQPVFAWMDMIIKSCQTLGGGMADGKQAL